MSAGYRAVQWNRQKRIYDALLTTGVIVYLALFIGLGIALRPDATIETLLIRAFGSAALILLHGILWIGPLCRLDPRFLPLLYNRRHLGVTMFLLAMAHSAVATLQFHAFGDLHPLVSIFVSNPSVDTLSDFPFQPFGLAALGILFLMAATSHDFWLANLSAPVWKSLHMGVYVAYVLLVVHVAFGVLQGQTQPLFALLFTLGMGSVVILHLLAGFREAAADRGHPEMDSGWVRACRVDEIPEKRARIVPITGERVAIFRYDGKIAALSNVCQHQNGPLGEGAIVDGCVTCPWHGYQYDPESGQSPAPFDERIPTFRTRIDDGWVWVEQTPGEAGARMPPATIRGERDGG